jgi:5-formyltetrahydrofolate cyclo-ligase
MDKPSLKKELRKEMKATRRAMAQDDIVTKSRAIYERWRNRFSLKRVGYFHVFQSMATQNEVDTQELIQFVWDRHPQVHIVVPVVDERHQMLKHAVIHDRVEMRVNKFGIPEPYMPVDFVHPVQIDMVMVPLLAFDDEGQRLGYGAGYYDKFLALTRPSCVKIGICFDNGHRKELLPSEPHDIPLDFVVTESTTIRFNPNFQI